MARPFLPNELKNINLLRLDLQKMKLIFYANMRIYTIVKQNLDI